MKFCTFSAVFLIFSTPAYSIGFCDRFINRASSFFSSLGLRQSVPLDWNESDWQSFDQQAKASKLLRPISLQSSNPILARDYHRYPAFGIPVTRSQDDSVVIHFDRIDWKKFRDAVAVNEVPFTPSFLIGKTKETAKYIRIGVDPLPSGDFSIFEPSILEHSEWAQLMADGTFPMSLDFFFHEVGHLFTYLDDPLYADEIRRLYQSGGGISTQERVKRFEEVGVLNFKRTPTLFTQLETAKEEIASSPRDWIEKFSRNMLAYGAIYRQIGDFHSEPYAWTTMPDALVSSDESDIPDFFETSTLQETFDALVFLTDLLADEARTIEKLENHPRWKEGVSIKPAAIRAAHLAIDRLNILANDPRNYPDWTRQQIRDLAKPIHDRHPPISWRETEWETWTRLVSESNGLKNQEIFTNDPLKIRDIQKLEQMGIPVQTLGPDRFLVKYTRIDWKKFVTTIQQSNSPYFPAVEFSDAKGRSIYIRIGIDPIPRWANKIDTASNPVLDQIEWSKKMKQGSMPFSPRLIWHEIGHLMTYMDHPTLAQSVDELYRSGEGAHEKPVRTLVAVEESGGISIRSEPDQIKKFLETNRSEATKDPSKFIGRVAEHLLRYGAVNRQVDQNKERFYGLGFGPEIALESIANPNLGTAYFERLLESLDLSDTYQTLRFLGDLKNDPEIAIQRIHSGADHSKDKVVLEKSQDSPQAFRAEIDRAIQLSVDHLLRLAERPSSYSLHPVEQIREVTPRPYAP